jgi:uncharacterized coiled-coil DUF342 family protein
VQSDNEDIDQNTDLAKNDCIEEKNGFEAKIEEHTKAIKSIKKSSKSLVVELKDFAKYVEESFKLLRRRVDNVYYILKGRIQLAETLAAVDHSDTKTEIQYLQEGQNAARDTLDALQDGLGHLLERDSTTDLLKDLVEAHNSNLKAAIEMLQNKDLTSEEATKAYDSYVRMLTEDGKKINGVYTKELGKQIDRFRATTKKYIFEQASIQDEVEGVKATLEDYAKENESLKDKIDDQQSTITALMDENWTFKLQISSLLYSIRSLEDKVDPP